MPDGLHLRRLELIEPVPAFCLRTTSVFQLQRPLLSVRRRNPRAKVMAGKRGRRASFFFMRELEQRRGARARS
jgi:hypothetical protein